MGRTLKRVPLGFDYPIGMLWKGYVNPYNSLKCESCGGAGVNPALRKLGDDWYDFDRMGVRWCHNLTQDEVDALMEADRLTDLTSRWDGTAWVKTGHHPTAQEVNVWSRRGIGHDAINQMICVEARAKRLGISTDNCRTCDGDGYVYFSDEIKAAAENWECVEPPIGEGFQLWSTTSEGEPTSPVFVTLDALCEWCETNATTFVGMRATAAEWRRMLGEDFVHARIGNAIMI